MRGIMVYDYDWCNDIQWVEGIYRGRGEVMLLRAGIDNTSGSLFMIYDSWL